MRIYVKPIHMQQQLGGTSFVCPFVNLFGVTYVKALPMQPGYLGGHHLCQL